MIIQPTKYEHGLPDIFDLKVRVADNAAVRNGWAFCPWPATFTRLKRATQTKATRFLTATAFANVKSELSETTDNKLGNFALLLPSRKTV